MLNPAMPDEGMDRQDYLTRKFGGADAASQVYGRIAEAGKAAGLNMRLDDIRRTPETRSAHQVTQALQADPELANIVTDYVHGLFQSYFVDGDDISRPTVLDAAVTAAGGPSGYASRVLIEGQYKAAVIQEDQNNRARGLTGVPGFLVGGQQFVGGAQPSAVFHRLFDIIVEQSNSHTAGQARRQNKCLNYAPSENVALNLLLRFIALPPKFSHIRNEYCAAIQGMFNPYVRSQFWEAFLPIN